MDWLHSPATKHSGIVPPCMDYAAPLQPVKQKRHWNFFAIIPGEDCWVSMYLMRWKLIPKATSVIFLQKVVCIAAFLQKECLACGHSGSIVLIAHHACRQHGIKWLYAIFIHSEKSSILK